MHHGPVRLRTLVTGQIRWRRIQTILKPNIVVQLWRQRPSQSGAARPVQIFADRALSQTEAAGDGALGHPDAVV